MKRAFAGGVGALLSGVLFGAGLVVSGMTRPSKVLAFLTLSKNWDPSLLFVMGGAIAVHSLAHFWMRRRSSPLAAGEFSLPGKRGVNSILLMGAAVFGVGWGLGGFCPGPAVVAAGALSPGAWLFVAALLLGRLFAGRVLRVDAVAGSRAAKQWQKTTPLEE
jgi:uncharacterized membrane protein YedE/YeeE